VVKDTASPASPRNGGTLLCAGAILVFLLVLIPLIAVGFSYNCGGVEASNLEADPAVGQGIDSGMMDLTPDQKETSSPSWSGRTWKEVVGLTGEEASEIILSDTNQGVTIQIVGPNEMVTEDYSEYRVRIYVNEQGVVTCSPRPA
jgi:hypothetical protein